MDTKLHKQFQSASENHFWFMVRDNLLKDISEKYFKKGDSVLDFGCNYGHSTKLLQNLGYKAEGVDVSEEAILYGKSIGISNIFLSNEKTYTDGYFDAIMILDVLEHVEDDKKIFEYLTSVLKKDGIMVIMVPAFMFLWGVQDTASYHFRRYTLDGLVNLSKRVGNFEIIKKSYFNIILFFPIALVRLFTRFFISKPRDSDININNSFLNKLFFLIFDFERKILRYFNMPFGVSILLVLRKK